MGLLKQVERWQKTIAVQLIQQSAEVSSSGLIPSELVTMARQLVLAILWMVLWQQRGITVGRSFQTVQQGDQAYQCLLADLRQISDQLKQPLPLALPEHLSICDRLLHDCITSFYHASTTTLLSGDLLGQVYQQSLGGSIGSGAEGRVGLAARVTLQKAGGIYYTPEPIVNYVVEQTIDEFLQKSYPAAFPLVLDPACGSGAFLLAAYQRLLDRYLQTYRAAAGDHPALQRGPDGQWRLTQAERSRILQAHLYGVDVDLQAVAITQFSLWLKLAEDLPDGLQPPLPDLSHNIRGGNAIMKLEGGFQWEQAFPQILHRGGFDVVIGNPPYIDSEQMATQLPHCRQYCGQHYRSATGNWDLFCIFIEKAIDLCCTGGWVSLVVPNKLASAAYARTVRQMLSQENQLLAIRDYAQVPVFAASVYPLVFVSRKLPPQAEQLPVRYELMQDLQQVQQARSIYLGNLHSSQPQQGWQLTTRTQSSLLSRLQRDFPALGQIAQVRGAATVAEAYRMQSLIQDTSACSPGDLQMVNSGTIDRYRCLWGEKRLRYLGQVYQHPVIPADQCRDLPAKRYQQAQQPKIIVAGMTQRLECALDATGSILAAKSTSIVWVEGETLDLRYLLGLLNSQLLSFYFSHAFNGNQLQGGYFRVGPPQLRSLPISIPERNSAADRRDYTQMIEWVGQRLICQSKPEIQQLDRNIDQLVYQLYDLTATERHRVHTDK